MKTQTTLLVVFLVAGCFGAHAGPDDVAGDGIELVQSELDYLESRDSRITLVLVDRPLREVIQAVSRAAGFQLELNDGGPWSCRTSGNWKSTSVRALLNELASAHGLTFRVPSPKKLMHALDLVDMNGDGLKDIATGKRFWAHGPAGDPEPNAPALLYWFELRREPGGQAVFVPHLIDDDSGVGTHVATADLNGDRRPDVIVGNKKGIFVHLSPP